MNQQNKPFFTPFTTDERCLGTWKEICWPFGKVVTFQMNQLKKRDILMLWCLLKQFQNQCPSYHSAVSWSGNSVWVKTNTRSSTKYLASFLLLWAWYCYLLRLDIQFITHNENVVVHVLAKALNLISFYKKILFCWYLSFSIVFSFKISKKIKNKVSIQIVVYRDFFVGNSKGIHMNTIVWGSYGLQKFVAVFICFFCVFLEFVRS